MPKREEAWRLHQEKVGKELGQEEHDLFVAGWQALIDMLDGSGHIARISDIDFTLQHPIVERLEGSLMTCPMHQLVHAACVEKHIGPGDYRVWLDRGALQWEEISTWDKR